jgi:calcium permeable stress-gated cation channel
MQMEKNGMDAYMFLRFLRLLIVLFASITLLTWVVLLPVDTAGLPHGNFTDRLLRLSWGKYVPHTS